MAGFRDSAEPLQAELDSCSVEHDLVQFFVHSIALSLDCQPMVDNHFQVLFSISVCAFIGSGLCGSEEEVLVGRNPSI